MQVEVEKIYKKLIQKPQHDQIHFNGKYAMT